MYRAFIILARPGFCRSPALLLVLISAARTTEFSYPVPTPAPQRTPRRSPVQGNPPSEIVTVTCLVYARLTISLLAIFVAMLGKQWRNRYL